MKVHAFPIGIRLKVNIVARLDFKVTYYDVTDTQVNYCAMEILLLYIYINICVRYLGRTKMAFGEIDPRHHKFWQTVEFLKEYAQKNLEATILCRLLRAFDSIHRGKMEQILLVYGLPKETVVAIMMLFKNTKVKVRSTDADTDYFDIVAGVLQGDILALYLFIICLVYTLRTSFDKMKDNGFKLTKERSRSTNNYGRRLRRWHSASGKCTRPSWIPGT